MNLRYNKILSSPGIYLFLAIFTAFPAGSISQNTSKKDNSVKVAMLQLNPIGADIPANMEKGDRFCRMAKKSGADIALFPEIWSIGYTRYNWPGSPFSGDNYPVSFESWKNSAITEDSEFIRHFRNLARELEMAIVITYLEKWEGLPRNSATVVDQNGNLLMTYAKVHTSDMKVTESNCTPGDDFYVCGLPLKEDTVKIGIMICFDREFPESARILMLKGAELILTPNACRLDEKQLHQFQTRAFENSVGVAMANYASPAQNGRSCAFDAKGEEITVADESEGIFMAEFNIGELRNYRRTTIWGNAYRRPAKYKLLISPSVDTIFIRKNGLDLPFNRLER